jgi:hypothetical protein
MEWRVEVRLDVMARELMSFIRLVDLAATYSPAP